MAENIERLSDLGTKQMREKLMADGSLHVTITQSYQRRISEVPQVPIDIYRARGSITPEEYMAGEKLHRDFALSGQTQGTVSELSPRVESSFYERTFTEAQLEARERWRNALVAVNGKIGQLMVLNVCCYGYWLQDVNYLPYSPKQSMPRFREALNDLCKHYHIYNVVDTTK